MFIIKRLLYIFLFCLIFSGTAYCVQAQTNSLFQDTPVEKTTANPFSVKALIDPEIIGYGRTGTVRVVFSIDPGYKIYADSAAVIPENVLGLEFGTVKAPLSITKKEPDGTIEKFYQGNAVFELPVKVGMAAKPGKGSFLLNIGFQGCSETRCFFPEKKSINLNYTIEPVSASGPENDLSPAKADMSKNISEDNPYQRAAARFGIAGVLAAAFLWGFLASLTPCVYPMIPVTVSVIGATNSGSVFQGFVLSLFYVLGMSLTYAGFGVAAAWTGSLFGAYTDHPAIRIIVAGIFLILAIGMFDIFHIQMPSKLSSALSRYTGKGRIGVFLTGAAAGAVVGPCVGPMLVGLLIYIAAIGSKLQGFFIMWSFALGMGILFLLIGTFSGAASSLPKSGMWMVRLKNLFGLLMLAMSLWYIKPLLSDPIFFLCFGTFLIGISVFSGGLEQLAPESGKYDRLIKTIAIVCLTLGIAYSARFVLGDSIISSKNNTLPSKAGISWHTDETTGLELAKTKDMPVMIDFSADWCAACKKLDKETFAHPEVINASKNFICIKIDSTDANAPVIKRLQKKYGVVGLPTIIFLKSSGEILPDLAVTEFINSTEFLQRLNQIMQGQV
ncbi:protein-disulfide reductase DsbD [Desulfobacterales bacterium HSG17]|nr:protein-disulfide reductase DsbD [Desulfobacterales bacterium HSG17]